MTAAAQTVPNRRNVTTVRRSCGFIRTNTEKKMYIAARISPSGVMGRSPMSTPNVTEIAFPPRTDG